MNHTNIPTPIIEHALKSIIMKSISYRFKML
nr:MAG TPA: hypothetical protein [Caudoviricetes sp.]